MSHYEIQLLSSGPKTGNIKFTNSVTESHHFPVEELISAESYFMARLCLILF